MKPSDLLKRYASLPTILDFDQELQLIQEMQQFELDTIVRDIKAFIALICRVQESHADNGIFEMEEDNEQCVTGFYRWLQELESATSIALVRYADGLELNYNEIKHKISKNSISI